MRTALTVFFVIAFRMFASDRTPDEQNTIDVFRRTAPAVANVKTVLSLSSVVAEAAGEGIASGFLIDSVGHVLTNYHVIASSSDIEVTFPGRNAVRATLVGTAPTLDIALLSVADAGELRGLIALPLGDSDRAEIGEKVLAIGNPLGFQSSLTTGVLSGLSRDLPSAPFNLEKAFLQTDAAINPGNSGGPLLDSAGRVIGINAVVARAGQNVGFAIPINVVKKVLPDLISMGHVYQPALGFSAVPIKPELATLFGLPERNRSSDSGGGPR